MKNTYDLRSAPDYLKRRMFLDGSVTVQRFEEYRYPRLAKFEELQRGFFWVPEEITLTKDKIDFKEATASVKHMFTANLLRQTALDSIQGRAPFQIFAPFISVPELESLTLIWSMFETNIHSRSYSHIIRNIYAVPRDVFNSIHDTQPIIDMAADIGRYYDQLHRLNCLKETADPTKESVLEPTHIKAIWLALNASYALEALRFMVSFATSLAMVENRIFIGNGNIISLILQDELLHAEWTAWIINQIIKEDERFARAAQECRTEVYDMYLDVIAEEKAWADYLFSHGVVIGLNKDILRDFVDHTAYIRLKEIGIKYLEDHPKSSPLPWFNKHVMINKKQTALQENESTNYLIGVLTDSVNYEQLPEI